MFIEIKDENNKDWYININDISCIKNVGNSDYRCLVFLKSDTESSIKTLNTYKEIKEKINEKLQRIS